jgi:hypothetical protein
MAGGLYLKALFWASEAEGRGFDPRQPRHNSLHAVREFLIIVET